MTSQDFDIVVIGAGCVGASVFHELVQRSPGQIALVDHGRTHMSATWRSGGMLRALHERPEHTRLALRHLELLDLYQKKGQLRTPATWNGSLYFFNEKRLQSFEPSFRLMKEAGRAFELLTPDEGAQRFPAFRWKRGEIAVFEPRAGHLAPARFVDDLLQHGGRAKLFMDFEVQRLCPYLDRFRICGETTALTAKTLVLAGGARLLPRLEDLGLRLPLQSRCLTVHKAPAEESAQALPNFFDRETLDFARFGASEDQTVVLSDPRALRLHEKPWREPIESVSAEDCYAPERLGLVGEVPGQPGLYLATGWGGTAFKFSLEIGRQMAAAITRDVPERTLTYAHC